MKSKIYTGVDVFKLLAAIGVVAIHSNLIILKTLGRLSVPFFVIISSFFFFKKDIFLTAKDQKSHLLLFEKRIFLLLIYWDVVYIPLAINFLRHEIENNGFALRTIVGFGYHYILAPANTANGWGPSWYLVAMMIGLFIFVYLLKIFKKHILIFGGVLSLFEIYYILADEFQNYTHLSNVGVHGFLRLMIYIFVGYVIALKLDSLTTKSFNFYLILMIITVIIFMVENAIIWKLGGQSNSQEVIMTVPTSTAVSVFSLKWQPKLQTLNIRRFSTFLYCSQAWPMKVLAKFITPDKVVNQILTFVLIVAICFAGFLFYKWIRQQTEWTFWRYMV